MIFSHIKIGDWVEAELSGGKNGNKPIVTAPVVDHDNDLVCLYLSEEDISWIVRGGWWVSIDSENREPYLGHIIRQVSIVYKGKQKYRYCQGWNAWIDHVLCPSVTTT